MTLVLEDLDVTAVLDETLADALPDEQLRKEAIHALLDGAATEGEQRPQVLWCWGPAGYESPSAPFGTAKGQAKYLGVELSYRVSAVLRHLPEDGSVPADPEWGESGRWVRQALAGVVPDGLMGAVVGALLDGRTFYNAWGWELADGTVYGSYPRDMAEAKAPVGARLWRFVSIRTKPRGHHRIG